jgi:hypothetical protein
MIKYHDFCQNEGQFAPRAAHATRGVIDDSECRDDSLGQIPFVHGRTDAPQHLTPQRAHRSTATPPKTRFDKHPCVCI